MTEEEKKEFEEFLQWKAERAKRAQAEAEQKAEAAEKMTEEAESQENDAEKMSVPEEKEVATANDAYTKDKEQDNGCVIPIIAGLVVFVVFLLVLITSHRDTHSDNRAEAYYSAIDDSTMVAREVEQKHLQDSLEIAEQARLDSIAREERIAAVKHSIKITSAYLGSPNSASGVDAYFYYKNVSDKVIKYLVWIGYPINAVNDRVECDIRGYADFRGKDTGPVNPGRSSGGCWDCAWYNWTAKKLIITGIEIEYMDGTTFTIREDEIQYVR